MKILGRLQFFDNKLRGYLGEKKKKKKKIGEKLKIELVIKGNSR